MEGFQTPKKPATANHLLNNLAIPQSPFMRHIGYGTGVNVYLFERSSNLPNGYQSPWAVKKISKKNSGFSPRGRLVAEAAFLRELNHPNVIGFRAFVQTEEGTPCLAMEMGEKSLTSMIEVRSDEVMGPFPARQVEKVAYDIAKGLDYLHNTALVLHGDIKSMNILIKGDFQICKLCDFGTVLRLTKEGVLADPEAEYIGTYCWTPREALNGDKQITHKSDIYPYGLALWEMLALQVPHTTDLSDSRLSSDSLGSETELFEENLDDKIGTSPELPNNLDESYGMAIEIVCCCTTEDAEKRPSAQQIVEWFNMKHKE